VKLKNFEHVLLIGGGIGITGLLPYAQAFSWTRSEKQTMTLAYTAREPELVAVVQKMMPNEVEGLEFSIKATQNENARMDIGAVLRSEASKIERSSLAVVVCGPPGLADEVRREAVKIVGEGMRVTLFEESFCW
jgi:NAD(P)H-flavin reductase